MGGSTKRSPDTRKAPPVNILAEVRRLEKGLGEGSNSGAYKAAAYCAQPRNIPFQIFNGASAKAGEEIQLRIADPPQVSRGAEVIGEVSEVNSKAMLACLKMGYQMTGNINSISVDGKTGFLSIRGERRKVA